MKRREFIRKSVGAGAAAAAAPMFIPSSVFPAPGRPGANDRIQIGFIGLGGRARWLMEHEKPALSAARIVAVSDAFIPRAADIAQYHPDGKTWKAYQDYHEMFDKEKLDAVFVETTTHARVLVLMHAMQAGLDVYGEKPLTLTIAEGRALVNAVAKTGRVLQTGTQQRSMPLDVYASRMVREGALGKVSEVIACNFLGPARWPGKPGQDQPEGLDWDVWCNQTELRPYHPELQYSWALWWDYDGGGQSWGVTGWGTHALDQVQCALGTDDTGPVEIRPEGEGPECKVTMRYANGTLLKLHGEPRKQTHEDLGAIFVGDKGKMEILRGDFRAWPKEFEAELRKDAPPPTPEGANESQPHIANFFECMRTRKQPNADVETGHRATTLCHLMNICRDVQRPLKWDPVAEKFADDEANGMRSRPRRKGYELPEIG
jgi:predicted dehydrogenase